MADNDVSQLSESQRQALEQFTAVTAQETKDAIPLLRRSQWNVEVVELLSLTFDLFSLMCIPPDCDRKIL